MKATLQHNGRIDTIDLDRPIDLSCPLVNENSQRAWYVDPVTIEPVRDEHFTGSVSEGGPVNFRNISFNPHGHGTHTESVGHIAEEVYSVNKVLTRTFFPALVVSLRPRRVDDPDWPQEKGDEMIGMEQMKEAVGESRPEALVLRTLPNSDAKRTRDYSDTNPPYLHHQAVAWLRDIGVKHFLLDLPSVDKEDDEGKLLAHKAFWNYPAEIDRGRTITELIHVPDEVEDGEYWLDLQVAPIENDAAPSRPLLFPIDPGKE